MSDDAQDKQLFSDEEDVDDIKAEGRPQSIKIFEQAFLWSIFIELKIFFRFPETRTEIFAEEMSKSLQLGFVLFILVIFVLLALHASRNRSNVAKWIIVVSVGFSLLSYIPEIALGVVSIFTELDSLQQWITVKSFLECFAISYLFVKESRDWFRRASPAEEAKI